MNFSSEVRDAGLAHETYQYLLTYSRLACSIWCVELLRRDINRSHPEAKVNAILIDFFLYDTMKQLEAEGKYTMPHHRTRSIWY